MSKIAKMTYEQTGNIVNFSAEIEGPIIGDKPLTLHLPGVAAGAMAGQVTVYASPNGSSESDGSSKEAPTTLERALHIVSESGGAVHFLAGTYQLPQPTSNTASPPSPAPTSPRAAKP